MKRFEMVIRDGRINVLSVIYISLTIIMTVMNTIPSVDVINYVEWTRTNSL